MAIHDSHLALGVSTFQSTVANGPLLLAAGVSLIVGVIGFLSPCVLPLIPGYLAYVTGLSGGDGNAKPKRMIAGAALFILGFTVIYIAGGLLFGQIGATMRLHKAAINQCFGLLTIVLGLAFVGVIPRLQRQYKIKRMPSAGLLGAPLLGAAFGFSWGPCLTPTFGVVFAMSQSAGSAGRGAFLTAFYCFGIGLPLMLLALGIGWVTRVLALFRRHSRKVSIFGGVMLVSMGVLLITGQWQYWMDILQSKGAGIGGFQV